jgi:hypothetical protein
MGIDAPVMAFMTEARAVDVSAWRAAASRASRTADGGYSGTLVALTARDVHNRIIARVYCASALRGVCGISAQRRS